MEVINYGNIFMYTLKLMRIVEKDHKAIIGVRKKNIVLKALRDKITDMEDPDERLVLTQLLDYAIPLLIDFVIYLSQNRNMLKLFRSYCSCV